VSAASHTYAAGAAAALGGVAPEEPKKSACVRTGRAAGLLGAAHALPELPRPPLPTSVCLYTHLHAHTRSRGAPYSGRTFSLVEGADAAIMFTTVL
jgi:hypothetical protein